MHVCDSSYEQPTSKNEAVHIYQDYSDPHNDHLHTLVHADNAEEVPFFYSQDYYITLDEARQEYDVQISLSQKFIDKSTITPILEILQENVDIDDVDTSQFKSRVYPKCKFSCLIGGHRTYNQVSILATLPAGTIFRLWLQYSVPQSSWFKKTDTCTNYQLAIQSKTVQSLEHDEELQKNLKCEHTTYLPETLNQVRYLGAEDSSTQQDFNYIENFRVDNVHKSAGTKFTLKEKTVVRIDGFEHSSLMFRLNLM